MALFKLEERVKKRLANGMRGRERLGNFCTPFYLLKIGEGSYDMIPAGMKTNFHLFIILYPTD